MIIGAEIALLFLGVYALIAGKLPANKKSKDIVLGWPARIIGIICLLPLPLACAVNMAMMVLFAVLGRPVTHDSFFWVGTAIEGAIVVGCVVVVAVLSRICRVPVAQSSTLSAPASLTQIYTCPQCLLDFDTVAVRNGKSLCPECGVLLSLARTDDSRRQSPSESYFAEKPQKTISLPVVLIFLGLGLGLTVLLIFGGGVAAYLYFNSGTSPSPIASATQETPENTAPVAAINPEPAKETTPSVPETPAAGGNGKLPLKELKAATVYIHGQKPTRSWSGSGFVVLTQGNTVYVATNHHVVSPPEKNDAFPPQPSPGQPRPGQPMTPRRPGQPMIPRIPSGPRRPIVPRMPRRSFAGEVPPNSTGEGLTVVFNSGTAKEQSLAATVVGDDAVNDLAILRTVGVLEPPQPIQYERNSELMETMPVVMLGFPLGKLLDLKKANPTVTVTKGSISALRGMGNEIEDVQLDIDMNPGNSGGPVVNEKGDLIGMAYAGWNNTNINFAIPVPKLKSLLQGRIDPPGTLEKVTEQGHSRIRIRASATDPFGKIRSPTLLYGPANEVQLPQKGANGWAALSGGKSTALILEGSQATATLSLAAPSDGDLRIVAQVSYQTATGQTIHGEPRVLTLSVAKTPSAVASVNQPVNTAPSPTVTPRPDHTPRGEELTKLLAELKSTDEAARERASSILQQTQALKTIDAKVAEMAVSPLLADSNVFVRCAAVKMLGDVGGRDGIPMLEKLAKENNVFHSGLALQTLASIRDRARIDPASPSIRHEPAVAVKSPGLLAYWSFEEGEGERAADASGNDFHAKLVKAGWTQGARGKALKLSGPGSYLDYGDSPRLSFTAQASFSIAFWTRTIRSKGTLLSQRHNRDGSALIDILLVDGKAKAQVRQDGNDIFGPTEVLSRTINDGAWHHLALTREGDRIELFVNGVSQGRKSGKLSGGAITTNLRALGAERHWLNLNSFIYGDPHFEGDMDEFCIFDRVLKANEIAALALR